MNDGALWDKALEGADQEKISMFAVEVPKVLAQVSTGVGHEVVRKTGLILTKEQIISIKKYVAIGLAFPTTRKGVADFLRYAPSENGGPGLTVEDFLSTFVMISRHAEMWSPLRHRIMLTGTDLKLFGSKMQIWGEAMQGLCNSDAAIQLIDTHKVRTLEDLNALKLDWPGVFPGVELAADTVPELNEYLQDIRVKAREYHKKADAIKVDLDAFGDELEKKVIPEIKVRLALIGSNRYPSDIVALDKKITERAVEIEELNSRYRTLVEKSLGAAAMLNIVGLGMAIYFGVEAENIRAQRKRVNAEQEADIRSLESKERTLASLKRVELDLQNAKIVAIDAEVATNNLRFVWNSIERYIDDSEQSMGAIKDGLRLSRFMSKFNEVVDSWKKVADVADQLVEVFDQADQEYKANNNGAVRMARFAALTSAGPADNLQINPEVLSGAKRQMRQDRAKLDALYQILDYLPGVYERFAGLVDNVFNSHRTLQESAINSHEKLERAAKALTVLKNELAREMAGKTVDSLVDEIINDCHEELSVVYASVEKDAAAIEGAYALISVMFDRDQTVPVMSALTEEVIVLEKTRKELEESSTKIRADLKVITDAISALEKKGLEDVGKEVNLTIDKINGLGMAPPQVEIVKLAIEQLQRSIASLAEGVSFMFMLAESQKLRANLNECNAKIASYDAGIVTSNKKIEYIQTVYRMDDQSSLYATEFKHTALAFKNFLTIIAPASGDVIQRVDKFFEAVPPFLTRISPLTSPGA
ncbi:hypothetical protein PS918_01183 [Pseudomonas fluorescens]|uniref:Uncharacterized protein n=1 Tax=Pseudomonas fluorescens TaxID=294 RepID=A0A5E7RD84_PSEFL|nr:alpha-xenorhabdolysin family binary toxin subunit A [Pseudomonas fluorescens]VVP71407.1 hypothetical protein PS918_01183 [Pseudomonas fluorescens]